MKKIKWFVKKRQLTKDNSYKKLANRFLEKSRQNLMTMSLISELKNKKIKKLLKIPEDYDPSEWVVICGYYSMYSAALSLLAKIGYRSKNHSATLCVLNEFFLKKKILDKDYLTLFKSALFHKKDIERLSSAKHKREIAQYSITKKTTKSISEKIKKDAYKFVNKCEEVLNKITKHQLE